MNAIIGLTELLINKKLDENSSENLKAIRFSANNLLTIINDILDFSKIEAGKFTFEIQAFDFFSVLEELNKSITLSALAKNILYEIQISGSIPKYLKGDAVRLSQILLNLLGNSIKFTQSRSEILPNNNQPLKIAKLFKKFAKVAKNRQIWPH